MPDDGVINVPLMARLLYRLREQLGLKMVQYAQVIKVVVDPASEDGWRVYGLLGTDMGSSVAPQEFNYGAKKIAITAGAYVNHIVEPSFNFHFNLDIWEMVKFLLLVTYIS